jgi:UDP-glucose 4-epimerase
MPVASLRCFPIYGPRQHKQVVYDLMQRMKAGQGKLTVLGDGTQVRDFCFVEDIASAAMTVAAGAPMEGEAWNVGSGQGVSIQELVEKLARALRMEARPTFTGKIRPGDPEVMVADISRLRHLGWRPTVGMDEGLSRTAAWLSQSENPPEQ